MVNNNNYAKNKTFYLDRYKENIIIISKSAAIFHKNINDIDNEKINFNLIQNNLENIRILDFFIEKDSIDEISKRLS